MRVEGVGKAKTRDPEAKAEHPGGGGKTPGEVRRSQVRIGGTRPGNAVFVPPPANALPGGLASLERFVNDDPEPVPPLQLSVPVSVVIPPAPLPTFATARVRMAAWFTVKVCIRPPCDSTVIVPLRATAPTFALAASA